MNNAEKTTLNRIIEKAIQNNGNKEDFTYPYGLIASSLRECELHFDFPTGQSYNQNRDLITFTFKCPDDDCSEALNNAKNKLIPLCSDILNEDGKYDLSWNEDSEPTVEIIKAPKVTPLPTAPKITFEHCEEVVIKNINNAQHSIFAAVAWINNEKILDALVAKAKEGVDILLIVNDDKKNRETIKVSQLPFPVFFALKLEEYWAYPAKMHLKFCVIDNQKAVYGTFNWTNAAAYKNDEDVHEDENKESVRAYVERFKKLRVEYNAFYSYPKH
jgi:phosphatidylserine/phosphatidylglycerophosphate/cardiolipin synthase-like enzyme